MISTLVFLKVKVGILIKIGVSNIYAFQIHTHTPFKHMPFKTYAAFQIVTFSNTRNLFFGRYAAGAQNDLEKAGPIVYSHTHTHTCFLAQPLRAFD